MPLKRGMALLMGLGLLVFAAACGGGGTTSSTNGGGTVSTVDLNEYVGSGGIMLLKIGGGTGTNAPEVKGESLIEGYTDWIVLESINLSFVREFAESAKAGTQDLFTGVTEFQPIEFTKPIDLASPHLLRNAWGGGAIATHAVFVVLATGGAGMVNKPSDLEVYRIELYRPMVASLSQDLEGGIESGSLQYQALVVTYRPIDPKTGQADKTKEVKASWDRVRQKPLTGNTLPSS